MDKRTEALVRVYRFLLDLYEQDRQRLQPALNDEPPEAATSSGSKEKKEDSVERANPISISHCSTTEGER